MTFQIQHTEGEYKVVLTAQQMEALHLTEGAEVDIVPHTDGKSPEHRYLSIEEGTAIYREIEPVYRETFLTLAK